MDGNCKRRSCSGQWQFYNKKRQASHAAYPQWPRTFLDLYPVTGPGVFRCRHYDLANGIHANTGQLFSSQHPCSVTGAYESRPRICSDGLYSTNLPKLETLLHPPRHFWSTMTSQIEKGQRIPQALQDVFLASNRGEDVVVAPPNSMATKLFGRVGMMRRPSVAWREKATLVKESGGWERASLRAKQAEAAPHISNSTTYQEPSLDRLGEQQPSVKPSAAAVRGEQGLSPMKNNSVAQRTVLTRSPSKRVSEVSEREREKEREGDRRRKSEIRESSHTPPFVYTI
jgi:hypothetical protein